MMIPTKKPLNAKNQCPWKLCPSKSFPGKFYYFNDKTGEAAWCVGEVDKNIKKVTNKMHTYPEPFGPPDESTNTTNSFTSLKNTIPRYIPSPSFGQAVFPKYVTPEVFTPNVVWTLTPMYVPNQSSQPHRQMFDQIPQPYERDQPIFVQSSVPLNNQFQTINRNYPNVFQFQNHSTPLQHFEKDRAMFGQTNLNAFKSKEVQTVSKPQTKDEACQTFVPIRPIRQRTQSESDSTPKSVLKLSRSVENLASLFSKDETCILNPKHKVASAKADKLRELDKNDLRFLLVAKKKKEFGATLKSVEDLSKLHKAQEYVMPKKRVTFDLHADTSSEESQEIDQSPECSEEARQPAPPGGDEWYVVADTEALLADLQCIEQYVKRDGRCRLVIPLCVRDTLTTRGRGGGGALSARQLLRRLAEPTDYIRMQTATEYEHESLEDNIMQCCWDLLQGNARVVLITNNTKMLAEAKTIDLESHTIEEIKNGYRPLPSPKLDFKKLKIAVNNDEKKTENLFLQNINEIKSFGFNKINGFVHEPRINLFNQENNDDIDDVFDTKDDNSDKLINLTRKKPNKSLDPETIHAKDQTSKLSIAENNNVHNRTKLIMKNVFLNTGLNKIDQGPRNVYTDEIENYKWTLNKKSNADKNLNIESVSSDIIDEIDQDIRRLNFKEDKVDNRDTIKVSGITKLNCRFDLDDELKRFYVKNAIVENRIKSRIDEWTCRLKQIMDGVLIDVILKENVKTGTLPPKSLYEAIQLIEQTFKTQDNIKMITKEFSKKLRNCSSDDGDLKKDMIPNEFLKLVGFSKILLYKIKDVVNYKELNDAQEMLDNLLRNIEDSNMDCDIDLNIVNTPIFKRIDVFEPKVEVSFKKSRAEILSYLEKHFGNFKDSSETVSAEVNDETNIVRDKERSIVRTCGKNLSMLKINNTKAITVENVETHNNNNNKVYVVNEPKVIRNIDAFEERLKKKAEFDLDKLDYDESVYTVSSDDDNFDDTSNKIGGTEVSDKNNATNDLIEYKSILEDLSVSASSINTECVRAYPLIKIFLVTVKRTFLLIYSFIMECMRAYKEGMPTERKDDVRLRLEISHEYVLKMIERLKTIIARESGNGGTTLKGLLIKSGDYVEDDRIINNYKETIAQYLDRAEILEHALTVMLPLSNASPKDRDTGYSDTFNTPSPILPTRSLRCNKMVQLT